LPQTTVEHKDFQPVIVGFAQSFLDDFEGGAELQIRHPVPPSHVGVKYEWAIFAPDLGVILVFGYGKRMGAIRMIRSEVQGLASGAGVVKVAHA
jgi:hypothetical protein